MVVFNDPLPIENPPLQSVLMALEMRTTVSALIEKWRRLGHDIGFGIGIAHGFATLERAGGFGMPLDCDESFLRLIHAYTAGLRAESPQVKSD